MLSLKTLEFLQLAILQLRGHVFCSRHCIYHLLLVQDTENDEIMHVAPKDFIYT